MRRSVPAALLLLTVLLGGCADDPGTSVDCGRPDASADLPLETAEDAPPEAPEAEAEALDAREDAPDDAADDDAAEPDAASPCRGPLPAGWVRVMTFNIRHGAESSLEAVAEVIREADPDFVGLQEVDQETDRSGGVDQAHRLAQLTGMAGLFRTAIDYDGGRYGLAVLARWPILSSTRVALTSAGEQRILAVVDLLGPGDLPWTAAVTHLGLTDAERTTQAGEVAAALRDRPRVVLFGDFNAEPGSTPHAVLTALLADAWTTGGSGDGPTFPTADPTRRIDWILTGADLPPAVCAWVPATEASDHRPVVAVLPDG